jgi:hypothetical protein
LVVLVLVVSSALGACSSPKRGGAGEHVQRFYEAASQGDVARARAALLPGAPLRSLARRFGGLGSWASRATKNGTVARVEVVGEDAGAGRASVALIVMFNDGTRRHERLELIQVDGEWRIDPASLPGAPMRRARATRPAGASASSEPGRNG